MKTNDISSSAIQNRTLAPPGASLTPTGHCVTILKFNFAASHTGISRYGVRDGPQHGLRSVFAVIHRGFCVFGRKARRPLSESSLEYHYYELDDYFVHKWTLGLNSLPELCFDGRIHSGFNISGAKKISDVVHQSRDGVQQPQKFPERGNV